MDIHDSMKAELAAWHNGRGLIGIGARLADWGRDGAVDAAIPIDATSIRTGRNRNGIWRYVSARAWARGTALRPRWVILTV